jgi:hypothetical protein
MTQTRLEGIALEVLASGLTGPAGSILDGVNLEVAYRMPPGEGHVTQFRAQLLVTDYPADVHFTNLEANVSVGDDPAEARVTSEFVSASVGDDPSDVRVTHLYVNVLAENIPLPPQLKNCDLLLRVFDDDRETVRWQASTRMDVEVPYLILPERYAEQEIDPAAGSATLGTVDVMVADVPRIAGDQDSGWMTHKLAHEALADIHGRRAQLLRAIGEYPDQIIEVIIDGVAGNPRMDQSYAAFGFTIRDTREVERKIRCFDGSVDTTTIFLPTADTGKLGTLEGYGYNPEDDTYLLPPIVDFPLILGLTGTFNQNTSDFPNATTGSVDITGNPADRRTVTLNTYQLWEGQVAEDNVGGPYRWQRVRFPNLKIRWRDAGTPSDPYSEIDGAHLILDIRAEYVRDNLGVVTTDLGDNLVRIDRIAFGDDRIGPAGDDNGVFADYSPDPYDPPLPGAALPAHGQAIEFLLVASGPASATNPMHIDGLTAGQFAKNVYDGVYSARDENGDVVPTGILYDETALLAMTEPVRMRITAPITDARDWLEKHIYAPTGWIPALDIFGRISPVHQEAPQDILSLPLIYDHITEPSPAWDSGERIVNVIRFTYKRDYIPEADVDPETSDGLSDKEVVVEFRDPVSIQRHGEQLLEVSGEAFRAIGTEGKGDPALSGGISAEQGHIHATERGTHLLPRYALGAPVMTVAVRRAFTPDLRAGSWVRTWLSWFPDYVTQRRGLITLCQITSIGDLDCVWRQVTMEQVLPLELYEDDGGAGFGMLMDRASGRVLLDRATGNILLGQHGD